MVTQFALVKVVFGEISFGEKNYFGEIIFGDKYFFDKKKKL